MGQIKASVRFQRSMDEEDLSEEDAASRRRIERYKEIGCAEAIEGEQSWREDTLGLGRV